jgi:hypothetical protein
MVAEALAHHALARLAEEDPALACARLGPEASPDGVAKALGHLRAALREDGRPDVALDLFRARIAEAMPRQGPDRRAAVLTLMLARGAARDHIPLPFDERAAAMDL